MKTEVVSIEDKLVIKPDHATKNCFALIILPDLSDLSWNTLFWLTSLYVRWMKEFFKIHLFDSITSTSTKSLVIHQ